MSQLCGGAKGKGCESALGGAKGKRGKDGARRGRGRESALGCAGPRRGRGRESALGGVKLFLLCSSSFFFGGGVKGKGFGELLLLSSSLGGCAKGKGREGERM